jgi:hypothetical protein
MMTRTAACHTSMMQADISRPDPVRESSLGKVLSAIARSACKYLDEHHEVTISRFQGLKERSSKQGLSSCDSAKYECQRSPEMCQADRRSPRCKGHRSSGPFRAGSSERSLPAPNSIAQRWMETVRHVHACTERSHRSAAPEIEHVHAKFVSRDLPQSCRQRCRACLCWRVRRVRRAGLDTNSRCGLSPLARKGSVK